MVHMFGRDFYCKQNLGVQYHLMAYVCWSFVYITKDLYLVITLNLIFLLLHEIWQISPKIWWISCGSHMKSARFHLKFSRFHAWKPLNQIIQEKFFTFIECRGEAMSYEPCEIHQVSWNLPDFVRKDHLPGMIKPMFIALAEQIQAYSPGINISFQKFLCYPHELAEHLRIVSKGYINLTDQKIVGNSFQPIGGLITGNCIHQGFRRKSYSERHWPDRQHTIS